MASIDEKLLNVLSDVSKVAVNPFKDKWISILGDSISTYEGWIPSGNSIYYPKDDVDNVNKTWWHMLLSKLEAKLCVNQSWSGRRVTDDGATEARAASLGMGKLHREVGQTYKNLDGSEEVATTRINPDVILILLGTNDYNNGVAVGELTQRCVFNYPLTSFSDSYYAMLKQITADNYKLQEYFY